MTEKQKSIRFNATVKTKDVDGERRIVFVASSGSVDRDYERVDVPSLRLPLKAGGEIQVSQIGSEGVEGVDIPLMLNHSGDIRDVIGSVRKAWFENGELIFEAGISSRGIAQEILTLIDEGHLSNAFSITMIDFDFDYDTETIRNAEVIEVSVVYRGSNKDARLLAVKSLLGGEQMEEAEKVEAPIEAETVETVEEPVGEAPVEQVEESANEAEAETEKEEAEAEEPVDETATEQEQPAEPTAQEEPKEKEQEMEKEIAQDAVVAKATPVQTAKSESNYLASKKALADFKNIVLSHHRGDNASIMKAWMSHISSKAISGDAVLPTRIEQIFFKTWTDKAEILNTFRTLGVRAGAVYAMKATSNGTALAHEKGETKLNQEIEAVRRDLKSLGIYKKLPIDLQDLFDDETGELLAFRVEELAGRVAHAIVVGAIVGGYADNNGRGLFSMKGDLDGASASPADDFGSAVATVIPNSNTDSDIAKAIKTCGAVKGDRRILIVPAGWMTTARIALIGMNYPVADLAEFVGADEIHELDEMTGSGYDMIAYARDSYVLAGEANASVRTDFDLDKNQDVMLVERYVGGSMTGYKNLAGYASA
jgi:flagellar biosynthesis GTPase FlhF